MHNIQYRILPFVERKKKRGKTVCRHSLTCAKNSSTISGRKLKEPGTADSGEAGCRTGCKGRDWYGLHLEPHNYYLVCLRIMEPKWIYFKIICYTYVCLICMCIHMFTCDQCYHFNGQNEVWPIYVLHTPEASFPQLATRHPPQRVPLP